MKKRIGSKVISLLLALMMIVSIIPLGTITASAATSHSQAEAVEWIKARANESWWRDVDGAYGCQCVDLIYAYYQYLIGYYLGGNGCSYTQQDKVPNGWWMDNTPSPGAIIAWGSNVDAGGWSTWWAGHVGLVYDVKGNNVYTVETNTAYPYEGNRGQSNARYLVRQPKNAKYIHPNFANLNYKVTNKTVSNINNTTAEIGFTIAPSANANSWGFYIGTTKSAVDNGSATKKTVSKGTTCDVATYAGDLNPNTTYYYKIWVNAAGRTWNSSTASFKTTNEKPGKPTLSPENTDIGIGGQPTITWKTVSNVKTYTAKLYDSNGNTVQEKTDIGKAATSYTFEPINEVGTYKAYIYAENTAGKVAGTPVGTVTVHPDVTVTFRDEYPDRFVDYVDDGSLDIALGDELSVQTVHYGESATAPANPTHTGYTFSGWDNDFKNVTSNITVRAKYKRNTYTVKFVSENGNILKTESVPYYSSATAPEYSASKTGYLFTHWDKDFSHVSEDMTVSAVIDWYNKNYSVYTTVTSAVRDDSNKGYDISVNLQNNAASLTTGRIVVALKTADNKMLTSSESAAFSVKANASKNFDIFVPYENAASKVCVYVVDSYSTMTPIAQEATANIDMGLSWTSWSTELPGFDQYVEMESRTEYRYKTLSTMTSYDTAVSGYTQDGYTLVKSGSGTIDYVNSWPSAFDRNSSLYKQYNKTPKTASESATQKTVVSNSNIGYLYWHWAYPLSGYHAEDNREVGEYYNKYFSGRGNTTIFEAFFSSSRAQFVSGTGYNVWKATGHSTYSYWWFGATTNTNADLTVKRCSWTSYNKLYNYSKVSDWSEWTTEELDDYEDIETRIVYRYKPKYTFTEDSSGEARTIAGCVNVPMDLSQYGQITEREFDAMQYDDTLDGKQVTLYIYKIDEASDYSIEYIGQGVLEASSHGCWLDGEDEDAIVQKAVTCYAYHFDNIKLREEPSIKTGDFTVALGIEGASSLIYLDPIEAPKKTHTVTFRDWDGTVISTQQVVEGESAILPDESLYNNREGYTFTHWSRTNTNITEDVEIFAEYTINVYTVVFVDWEARNVQIKKFEHGAELVAPDFEEPEKGVNVVWDKIADGVTTVTEDMVICTEYSAKTYDVVFRDFNGDVISHQTVNYGYAADVPELYTDEDKVFLEWQYTDTDTEVEDYIVTSKLDICPKYVFNETCEMPVANIESGEYNETQTVTLSTPTENAVIYYTLDGSSPTGENAIKYVSPITVRDYAHIRFYAVSIGRNDSAENEAFYVVNPDATTSEYLTYEQLPAEVIENIENYNVQVRDGYQFKNTVIADTVAAYESYSENGWTAETLTNTDWTPWQDDVIAPDDTRINFEVESQDVDYDVTSPSYKYSRFVYYVDGEANYSNTEVEGFSGTWEYAEVPQSEGYKIAGFTGGASYYKDADGGIWYNRTSGTLTQTLTKTQYRSRYSLITLYMWDENAALSVAPGETREYRTVELYTYDFIKHYIVTVYAATGADMMSGTKTIVKDGDRIDVNSVPEVYGFEFSRLYKDTALTQPWNINGDTVSDNIELFAEYTPKKFNVTFAYADGTEIETQAVDYLSAASAPEEIELPDGYIFTGWNSKEYLNVTKDMTVYARYVLESEYSTVAFEEDALNISANSQYQLEAQTSVPGKELEWVSSDDAVAIVDENGLVTGIAEGTATITVTVIDSNESAECTITVYNDPTTGICVIKTSGISIDGNGYIRGLSLDGTTVKGAKTKFANIPSQLSFTDINDNALGENDLIGTGTTVKFMSDSKIFIMTGDMTGDGMINNRDVVMMNRFLLDKVTPAEYQILAVDVNGDGNINNRDAAMIARYLVGKEVL